MMAKLKPLAWVMVLLLTMAASLATIEYPDKQVNLPTPGIIINAPERIRAGYNQTIVLRLQISDNNYQPYSGTLNCQNRIYDVNNNMNIIQNNNFDETNLYGYSYYNLNVNNINSTGLYIVDIICYNGTVGGKADVVIEAVKVNDYFDEDVKLYYILTIIFLTILLLFTLYLAFHFDNVMLKVTLFIVSAFNLLSVVGVIGNYLNHALDTSYMTPSVQDNILQAFNNVAGNYLILIKVLIGAMAVILIIYLYGVLKDLYNRVKRFKGGGEFGTFPKL